MTKKRAPKLACMLPHGPILTPGRRNELFGRDAPSGASYGTGGLDLGVPVVPFLPFGLTYELDLIFMTKHPSWNMHEYALVRSSEGLIWLAKDAREGTMEQTIIAGVDDIDGWMPEVPVLRRHQPVEVVEAIGPDSVDVSLSYVNWDGDRTEVHYEGAFPKSARPKRNGSTMGHSANQLMAVLDLPFQNLGRRGHVTIAGVKQRFQRIFGIPVRAALQQTQGGLVTGCWDLRADGDGIVSDIHLRREEGQGPKAITRLWQAADGGTAVDWRQRDAERELGARFARRGERLELEQLWAWQLGRAAAGFSVSFAPTLPDLRVPFSGAVVSHWVGDVAGQLSHARGVAISRWTDDGPEVELRPEEPWWVWDRPMRSEVRAQGEGVRVTVARTPLVGEPPSHGRCVAAG